MRRTQIATNDTLRWIPCADCGSADGFRAICGTWCACLSCGGAGGRWL